jgi:predicted dehydrogenase
MNKKQNNRREFLKNAVGISALAPGVVRAQTAASRERVTGSNDVIGMGVIGLGGNGMGHVRELQRLEGVRVVAVCDIYQKRLESGVNLTGAKGYQNHEELLDDPMVDAVVISTPDHRHSEISIDAMRAGKDVDVEKPMSLTIDEARQMVEVSKKTGQILAVDSEHTAHGIWKPARAAVKNGVLGKLLWSQTSRSRNSQQPPWNYQLEEEANPATVNWDRWQGETASRPFDRERFFRWRKYWEYSGGIATDLYVHHLTPLMKVTGPEFPMRAVSAGGNWFHSSEVLEVPDVFIMALDFPSRHTIVVGGSLANSVELPIVIRGHEANILFYGPDQRRPDYLHLQPEPGFEDQVRERTKALGFEGSWMTAHSTEQGTDFRLLSRAQQEQMIANVLGEAEVKSAYDEAVKKSPAISTDPDQKIEYFSRLFQNRSQARAGKPVFRIDSPPSQSFTENFLHCVRTREKPVLDGELGYMVQVAAVMAVESYRQNKVLFFNSESGKISDQPA